MLDVEPEAHQAKGIHGKTVFRTRRATLYRNKLREAICKAFLPYWNFDTMEEPIIPLRTVIYVEKVRIQLLK